MQGKTLVPQSRESESHAVRAIAPQRWMAIVLPWWSIDLVRSNRRARAARDSTPERSSSSADAERVLVIREHRGARQVVAACAESCAAGVRAGMKLAEARALSGVDSIEVAWDPIAERRALRRLASWCMRYAPRVMPVPGILGAMREPAAGGGAAPRMGTAPRDDAELNRMIGRRGTEPAIVVDITGCERVHGGETTLAARALRDLHRRGVHAQVAIASTQRAALAASAAWPCRVLPSDRAEAIESLAPLPLWTLRLSAALLDALRELNITRIGHALALPRSGAADRFGPELRTALDAMRGECVEDFHPLPHAAPIECECAFDGATTRMEAIERAVVQLLDRFCLRLARRQRGVRLLELSLDRIDALPIVERLTLGRPSRRAAHLWTLLRPRLERVNLGFGVEGVRLRALLDAPLHLEQGRWSAMGARVDGATPAHGEARDAHAGARGVAHAEDGRAVDEMIDQVCARLGHGSVSSAAIGALTAALRALEPCRPTVVFGTALSAEVTAEPRGTADAAPRAMRPIAVRWAGGGGRVMQCDGPERRASRWWIDAAGLGGSAVAAERGGEGASTEHDRWRVQTDDGRWLWLLQHGAARWSVIGVWA